MLLSYLEIEKARCDPFKYLHHHVLSQYYENYHFIFCCRSLLELPCILSNSKLTDLANRVENSNIVLQPHDLQTSKVGFDWFLWIKNKLFWPCNVYCHFGHWSALMVCGSGSRIKNHSIYFEPSKSGRKLIFSNLYLNFRDKLLFLVSDLKNRIS